MLLLASLALGVYSFLMLRFSYGWLRLLAPSHIQEQSTVFISVIIACRNEASAIEQIEKQISALKYPASKFEFLLINDHSDDSTWDEMQKIPFENVFCYNLDNSFSGKKSALIFAAQQAKGELLVFTDADCTFSPNWLSSYSNYYTKHQPNFIAGPVLLTGDGWWANLQVLEFMSLQITGAGAIALHQPIMCNGANMAVKRTVYLNNINRLKTEYSSGDDMFLMLALKKKDVNSVHFLKDRQAIVLTPVQEKLSSFLSQRRRWAGKAKGYKDVWVIFVGIIVFTVNLVLIVWLLSLSFTTYIHLLLAKTSVDILVLATGSRFFGTTKLLWYTLPLQIIYPVYVIFSVIYRGDTLWKGRRL